jgi:hypothetical protein
MGQSVRISRDSPDPKLIGEFTPNDAGFFASSFQDIGLEPGTLYTYSVCCEYSDHILCGSVTQRTSGSPPPPNATLTITSLQSVPAHLVKPQGLNHYTTQANSIIVTWSSNVPVDHINNWTVSGGGATRGVNIGGAPEAATSGTLTVEPPDAGLGAECSVEISAIIMNSNTVITATSSVLDIANTRSVRTFLSLSGVDPSEGIKNLLGVTRPAIPISLKAVMQIN